MGEKTTIEIDKIRELKQHALDTNKTLKQLINEAIDEKIQRERSQLGLNDAPEQVQTKRPVDSTVLEKTKGGISALEKILANAGLLTIVEKECSRHSLHLKDLSPATISQELMNDIHTAIKLVFDDETADQIIQRIEAIFNNL